MYDQKLLQQYNCLQRACSLASSRGERSAIYQLLVHATRAISICSNLDSSYHRALGSALESLRSFGFEPKGFMYWAQEVVELGEFSLSLCSRIVQVQNYYGQALCNLLSHEGNSPKSFLNLMSEKHLGKLPSNYRNLLSEYWDTSGKTARSIRDHEQHHPVDIGNCWFSLNPLPSLEIEYPLNKLGETAQLVSASRQALWDLITLIDHSMEIAGVELKEWSVPAPKIDQHDPRAQADGVIQIVNVDSFPQRAFAIEKAGEMLRVHSKGFNKLQSNVTPPNPS